MLLLVLHSPSSFHYNSTTSRNSVNRLPNANSNTSFPSNANFKPLWMDKNNGNKYKERIVGVDVRNKCSDEILKDSAREGDNRSPDFEAEEKHSVPPLISALKATAGQNAATFNFPGHNRGRAAPSSLVELIGQRPFLLDLPELDNLFSPEGPVSHAQREASKLFGASETWFLVGGTTCGIQAAIMATCSPGDTLILPRNSHVSAISAMVFSGAVPKYMIPRYDLCWDIAGGTSFAQVEKAIKELETEGRKAAAVFVTSPTYHGICSNVNKISMLCHSRNIPLIVDEAHGAHFGFHPELPSSSLCQGADLVVQSTHKVLCSLSQSSMLHMSGNIVNRGIICRCIQSLQSTSPSSLLLSSLDAARAQISDNQETIFDRAVKLAFEAKRLIQRIPGISVLNLRAFSSFSAMDPLRITVGVWELGVSGFEADDMLYKEYEVVSELTGLRSITFVITLGTSREHIQRLVLGLKHLSDIFYTAQGNGKEARLIDRQQLTCSLEDIRTKLSPREAFFARKRTVSFEKSIGEICGELICPYPPGVPLMIPGEIITKSVLNYLLQVKSKGGVITGAADPLLDTIVVCDGQVNSSL
ncbi:uncharacterized protein LOC141673920 [Apium graveolens]|uniref:uncharacterized protein LOC141673920 n=1 Tax=Apium graveolens TaxID=4045 RepID=UPI003D7938E6